MRLVLPMVATVDLLLVAMLPFTSEVEELGHPRRGLTTHTTTTFPRRHLYSRTSEDQRPVALQILVESVKMNDLRTMELAF